MIIWALVVGYSRIYLGVHYPGDVIAGSMTGAAIGWGAYSIYNLIDRKYLQRSLFFNSLNKES
jgi:undecaprenyl-diphosphatase